MSSLVAVQVFFAGSDTIKIVQHFTKNTETIVKSVQKLPIFGDFSLKSALEFAQKYLTTTFGAQRSQKVCRISSSLTRLGRMPVHLDFGLHG